MLGNTYETYRKEAVSDLCFNTLILIALANSFQLLDPKRDIFFCDISVTLASKQL